MAWLKKIPTAELIKRGKIEKQTDQVLTLKAVLGFFGVANVKAWGKIWLSPTVAYRKSASPFQFGLEKLLSVYESIVKKQMNT